MTGFVAHMLIHGLWLSLALVTLGWVLTRILSETGTSKFKLYIPFYNVFVWLGWLGLPRWLAVVMVQGYWLPLWWVEVASVAVFSYAVIKTISCYVEFNWRPYIPWLTAGLAGILFHLHPTHYAYIMLFFFSIGVAFMYILSIRSFNQERYEEISGFNFTRYAKAQFRKNLPARVSGYLLLFLGFIAVYADYLANSLPIYAEVDGKTLTPVTTSLIDEQPTIEQGARTFTYENYNWKTLADFAVYGWVPYSPHERDKVNTGFVEPSGEQLQINGEPLPFEFRHQLGTDKLGRDILSALVHGTRTSLTIGVVAMLVAAVLGIFLGALAGYFGDTGFTAPRIRIWLFIVGALLGYFYAFIALDWKIEHARLHDGSPNLWKSLKFLILFGFPILFSFLGRFFKRSAFLYKRVNVPLDSIINRLIEIMNSIPSILLILVIGATFQERSIYIVMGIIGLVSWTTIARLVRAEILRIRELDYVEAAKAIGYSDRAIIIKHVLPNALGSTIVAIAFGVAGAILMESALSFLNLGVPHDTVSWGALLNMAFENHVSDKIWLVVAPGIAIFITITVFNLIGEGLRDALDPKLKS